MSFLIIERFPKESIISLLESLLRFMFDVYVSTDGRYPKLEWLKKGQKPDPREPNCFNKFVFYYKPFLEWRLKREIDEIFIARVNDVGEIIGVIGINSDLRNKYVPWVPREFMKRSDVGFIELFAVHPNYRGRGIGSRLFDIALNRLRELGKRPLLTTFPDLEALEFYKRKGGRIVKRMDKYVIIEF